MSKSINKLFCIAIVIIISVFQFGCNLNKNTNNAYTGTVESDSYYVTSEVSGQLLEVSVKQGDMVKQGTKIAQVDTNMYEIQKKGAEGALISAKAKLDSLSDNAKDEIIKQAQGAVQQAQSSVDLFNYQISKCTVNALQEGMITNVYVHKGEMVSQGINIAKISDAKNKYVKIYVEESKRNAVKVGQQLKVSYKGTSVNGTVDYISPQSEFTPKNVETKSEKEKTVFEVKLSLKNAENLPVGAMVDIDVSSK